MTLKASFVGLLNVVMALSAAAQMAPKAPSEAELDGSAAKTEQTAPLPNFGNRYPRYQIRSGDVVELKFEFSPEFNQTVSVQPDGFLTLRGVGDINVSGLTVPELKQRLETEYGSFLNKPEIFVVLRDFDKPYFVATGMVAKPGRYELRGDVTVIEGIAMAGGLNESSKHSQVVLFRRTSKDWFEANVLNVKKMLASKDLSEDLHLKPGDIVYVPQNRISKLKRFIPSTGMGMSVAPAL